MKRLMLSALVVAACALSPSARAFEWLPLFQIRAMSMNPTLLDGDYVLAPSAGVATSLPRGQIVMYRNPKHQERTDVKRIVGISGDRVQMIRGVLQINGSAVPRERIEDHAMAERDGGARPVRAWREIMPDYGSYATLDLLENGFFDNTPPYTVPSGHYFVVGDNRDNSLDSRSQTEVGFVPAENIRGSAALIVWSVSGDGRLWQPWTWLSAVRWSRLFNRVR